jgi:hypothetical protein
MPELFYIEYGCSCEKCALIIKADHEGKVINYARQAAEDSYYSYDCNYIDPEDYPNATEEELAEIQREEMEYDIFDLVVAYDPTNPEHINTLKEQDDKPFEV